ncbi:MAG: ArsO family NAD(P)H-dependent flavin-containing monooxygenase [Proteobacteria bacterium]|nr:ArsO family NAD(P)H-dependent flavin-containing monooxygenase [Pseudomonadota bacterium]
MNPQVVDVLVIGGGQSGCAMGYYLRRADIRYIILDEQEMAGGAWLHGWDSLRLFSPARANSLPGWPMSASAQGDQFPHRDEVIEYLTQYQEKYQLNVKRPVHVERVVGDAGGFLVDTSAGTWKCKVLVSATGTWRKPYIPDYPGRDKYQGIQLHSADYRSPQLFARQLVLIVGGGNSGAQILAEISTVAETIWVTEHEPDFLPDHLDGSHIFDLATKQYRAQQAGAKVEPVGNLSSIIMVPPVKDARSRGVLESERPFQQFTEYGVIWNDGTETPIDAVIWCTGFEPSLDHLKSLDIQIKNKKIVTNGTRSVEYPGLWLVGYGVWTGFASSTLIGVGRTARRTVEEIKSFLAESRWPTA